LECWKNGFLPPAPLPAPKAYRPGGAFGSERMLSSWFYGAPKAEQQKIKTENILILANIPPFQYSIIP